MRIQLMKKAVGFSVTVSLIAYSFATTTTVASPLQTALHSTTLSPKLAGNTPVLARTTTAKSGETPIATPAPTKETKQQDKKAISRCWSRLMTMMREVRQAHQTKK